MRKFEKLNNDVILPKRQTKFSAGYDFYNPKDILIKSKEKVIIQTHIRCIMEDDEFLSLHIRSSLGIKYGLMLANVTGIIDKDYYGNSDNHGHILVSVINTSDEDYLLKKNERFVQGIFQKYLTVDDDKTINDRIGGIGSTN
ncbi:MAG: dUTP diphosphatase [Bacilli bacterium]